MYESPFDQPSYGKKPAPRKKAKKKAKKAKKPAPRKKAKKKAKKAPARKKAKKTARPTQKAAPCDQCGETAGQPGMACPTCGEIRYSSPRLKKKVKAKAKTSVPLGPGVKVVRGTPYCETCRKKCGITEGRFGEYWACKTSGCLGRCPQKLKGGEWTLPKARLGSAKQAQYVTSLQEKIGLTEAKFKALVKKALGKAKAISDMSKREISAVIDALKDAAIGEGVAVRGRSLRGKHAEASGYQRGDHVVWGRPGGEKTLSVVTRVNDRTLSVRTSEERGQQRVRHPGGKWTVPYSMIRMASQEEIDSGRAVQTRAPRKYTKRRGWRALLNPHIPVSDLECGDHEWRH